MVRIVGFLVGLGFVGALVFSMFSGLYSWITEPPAPTAEHEFHRHPRALALQSNGPFGTFDRQQLQRGFQVYQEVCAACHSLRYVSFRDLAQLGYNEPEVRAIANNWPIQTPSINEETGEAATRPSVPSDRFPLVFANNVAAAAANNNAVPPDLSLMTKARHDGAAYVYSLLTGYQDPDPRLLAEFPDAAPGAGLHHNPYFANLNLAMAPPLTADGQVTYADGTPATVDQMSQDVAAFLVWTAEPNLERRHGTGVAVVIFLAIFSVLAWMSYRSIWAGVKH